MFRTIIREDDVTVMETLHDTLEAAADMAADIADEGLLVSETVHVEALSDGAWRPVEL